MRPTIAEQLRETRRILDDLLRPQITDGYTTQIMTMAFANLEMLETAWADVLPFLHWDNDAALTLLGDLRGELPQDLAAEIGEARNAAPYDPFDAVTLETRNEALQALLERAIGQCGPEGRRRVHAHLLERTARYPMRPRAAALANARPTKDT